MFKNSKDLKLFKNECVDFTVSDASLDTSSEEERESVLKLFGDRKLYSLKQVHGDKILDTKDMKKDEVYEADGIYSSDPKVVSLIRMADCSGVLLYAKDIKAYTVVHAGRVGALKGIVSKAINLLVAKGAKKEALLAYITPHIRWCNYEVGSEIYEKASEFCKVINSKFYFDLEACIRKQLEVLEANHIYYEQADTFSSENLFSYRRDKTTKRFGIFCAIRS
ncbi:hypothetical protein BKH43_01030 [Helicobacter sp. 13S00401-1]|uniref:polyphenol oxidase family protein n=1 Tax=Helicobacter sp. 13S00401-1 TaxID=1905758 RepID=UPI000BA76F24|nr:polyphenol oxidase family protein [Helicobacter sp. 13S00401-1]PAF51847.1 hypothetical protein BKH43_01030 [Helicobacter sp. 13S00401-1]